MFPAYRMDAPSAFVTVKSICCELSCVTLTATCVSQRDVAEAFARARPRARCVQSVAAIVVGRRIVQLAFEEGRIGA